MSIFVKICGLTEIEHVNAAVDAGADALGFVFAESVRKISPQDAAMITKDVPDSVLRVAVMLNPSMSNWQEVADIFLPDVVQTNASDFGYLNVPETITTWPVFRENDLSLNTPQKGNFVYEGLKSGHGQTVDWKKAASIPRRENMILAGGLDQYNVTQAIKYVRPFGVDVSSAMEISPGQKCIKQIVTFISVVKNLE